VSTRAQQALARAREGSLAVVGREALDLREVQAHLVAGLREPDAPHAGVQSLVNVRQRALQEMEP